MSHQSNAEVLANHDALQSAAQSLVDSALAYASQFQPAADRLDAAHTVIALLNEQLLDAQSCAAFYLYALLPDDQRDRVVLAKHFDAQTLQLFEGLDRASQIEALARDNNAQQDKLQSTGVESVRKMLLAMAEDVRVVVIKLAERVVLLRGLTKAAPDVQAAAGRLTLDLFAPLANRLGVSQLKWELEDYAFRYLQPELYKRIAKMLDETRDERETYIAQIIDVLSTALSGLGVSAQLSGRPKHIYSIYRKMRGKNVAFENLYDIRAVRVIVPEVRDCYTVLGVLHDRFTPVDGEFDDYINNPKANNYRSLHTAIIGPQGKTVEVQVRTQEMHDFNENGVAAHWRYKEGGSSKDGGKEGSGKSLERNFDNKIAWLRQMLDFKRDLTATGHVDASAAKGLFDDAVYVLTPQGRVIALAAGSTPIDFAYHVHTDLGHRCRGAKVNGHLVPLSHKLANADRVEIVTAKEGGPSRDWMNPQLGFLHSPRALAKVKAWFRQQEIEADQAHGRTLLEKELQRMGLTNERHERIAEKLGYPDVKDLLIALARGEVTHYQMEVAVGGRTEIGKIEEEPFSNLGADKAKASSGGVLVLGVNNIATMVAKCCKPVPPDPIVGFVTRTRGVLVHRRDCANIRALSPDQAERLLPADWGKLGGAMFNADIEVVAADRQGLLRDISEAITREKVNVTAVNTQTKRNLANMRFTMQITDGEIIERVKRAVLAVPDVLSVERR
jgi:GTP pyrophosphokinase